MKFCLYCSAEIHEGIHRGRARKFCNRKCKFNYWKQNHRARYKELVTSKNLMYRKDLIIKWRAEGVCVRCGKPRDNPNLLNCLKCREYFNNYFIKYSSRKKEAKKLLQDATR